MDLQVPNQAYKPVLPLKHEKTDKRDRNPSGVMKIEVD